MAHPPLTRRQRDIVDFFGEYVAEHDLSPTLEEIAVHFGVNKVTIFGHVAELERKGVIRRAAKGISRALQLVPAEAEPQPTEGMRAPVTVLGRIAAGAPIEAIETPEELDLADLVPEGRDVYALRVEGDSMINDAICTGDVVLVERRSNARDGETVVAVLADGNATLKRLYHESDGIRLQPANDTMDPILLGPEEAAALEVRGVVIGVVRKYS
ncbi:MAG: repressor LexA [Planctomycetota bacterium]|jgi:repressor LexA